MALTERRKRACQAAPGRPQMGIFKCHVTPIALASHCCHTPTCYSGDGEGVGALVFPVGRKTCVSLSERCVHKLCCWCDGAVASPHWLDAVLVGFDEEILPALPRHVHPAAVVVDDARMQSGSANAGLLWQKGRGGKDMRIRFYSPSELHIWAKSTLECLVVKVNCFLFLKKKPKHFLKIVFCTFQDSVANIRQLTAFFKFA